MVFREKPTLDYLVSMGVYGISRADSKASRPDGSSASTSSCCDLLATGERIDAYPFDGYWLDIGRPDDYDGRTRTSRGLGRSCSGSEVSGVLVIGAAGLIGRAVLTEARRSGAANAVVASASAAVPDAHVLRLSEAAVDPLVRLLERLQPTAIVNASGRTAGDADELWQANVEPVATILEAMRVAAPGARLVHLGSAAEYAPATAGTTDEEAPLDASNPYAAAKLAAFQLVSEAAQSGVDAVVARVFNPIGPGMPPTSLPGRAARLLRDAVVDGVAPWSSSAPWMASGTTSTSATWRRP